MYSQIVEKSMNLASTVTDKPFIAFILCVCFFIKNGMASNELKTVGQHFNHLKPYVESYHFWCVFGMEKRKKKCQIITK